MQKQINMFLEELEIDRSSHTVSAYKRDLKIYTDFLKTGQDISGFYQYIDKQGFSSRSKARIISSVRAYFRFLESKGKKTSLRKLEAVPLSPHLPKLILTQEFKLLHQVASQEKSPHKRSRNQLTLLMLFGLGCRITELIKIQLKDISSLDHSLVVTGKRGKQRVLPLTEELFSCLSAYIQQDRPFLVSDKKVKSLLLNNRGKAPSRVDIWRWLALWSKKAGFSEVKSPHQFRHGFATGLLENGADLRSIQFLLGHSSIQTTQIYTSVRTDRLSQTIRQHHPLSSGSSSVAD